MYFFLIWEEKKSIYSESLEKKCRLTENLQKKIVHINSSLESNNRHSLHLFSKFTSKSGRCWICLSSH